MTPQVQNVFVAVIAAAVASEVVGSDRVDTAVAPVMVAEDFSFMLNARPGAFIFVGNGSSAGLHHASYDSTTRRSQSGHRIG